MTIDEVLGEVYDLFQGFYGQPLSDYLWGFSCDTNNFTGPNLYNTIGLITIAISFATAVIYYYVHKPVRWQRLWWLVYWIGTGVINLLFGFLYVLKHYNNNLIGDCLVYAQDGQTQQISEFTCFQFGLANFVFTFLLFFAFSMILKWGSTTGKYYPF